jgi:mannosylglycerate hydrolase
MSRDVAVVPHTHWDREWYEAYQSFRLKLIDLVDDLLPLLERDPAFEHFMLDGQMAVIDDYLEVRPENEARIRHLAQSGRLGMGPWYILMDEFLVSGETMVRDLRLGFEKAAAFGGAMEVGYLPDMFGHVAQMPQLLRQFGLEHAVVWRGVPSAVDRSGFWWSALDGSTVRAEYLLEGYGNGAALPDDAKDLVEMVERFESDHAAYLLDGALLWMNGTDHLLPKPWLGRVIEEANDLQDAYRFRVTSLISYLTSATTDDLPRWQGELRSGARANLLFGVGSNRVDVKQAAARAERELERRAEPLSALYLPADRWPMSLLGIAWREVIRNAAHDSSCACSIDEVCDAVLHRYAEARQIGEGLTERAVAALAGSMATAGPLAVNPSPHTRGAVVELQLPGTDPVPGTQVLSVSDGRVGTDGITRADTVTLVQAAMDGMAELRDVEVEIGDDDVLDVRLVCTIDGSGSRYVGPAKSIVHDAAGELPDGPARIAIVTPPSQRVLAWAGDVPGFGWSAVEPGPTDVAPVVVSGRDDAPTVTNGLVTIEVDPATGTFTLDGIRGLGRLVDDGDSGDTYNYCPPKKDRIVEHPASVTVRTTERGPLRARVVIERTYVWPERLFFGERSGEREVSITTTVEVRAGISLLHVTTELDNPCRDHRLRVWFPLPERATTSTAECAFAVVERGLTAEGGPNEVGYPTFPSRRFVVAGGLTVFHEGLLEYELVDVDERGAGALALTLLRCTGLLSNAPMASRPLPAGPFLRTDGAQVLGPHTLRYALMANREPAAAFSAVDDAFLPMIVTRAPGGGTRGVRGSELTVQGAVVSSVQRDGGQLVVRVFNPTPAETTVGLPGRRGWLIDLRGRPLEAFDESFPLAPWRIATAQLTA